MRRPAARCSRALACAALWPAAHARAQGDPPGRNRGSEVKAVRDAHGAQRDFEFVRRTHLPTAEPHFDETRRRYFAYSDGCSVRIGRFCISEDGDDSAAPPEPPATVAARARLLDALGRAAAADPGNGWVAGQRVRYLLEARRPADALAVAARCEAGGDSATAPSAWCLGLRGVVLHAMNRGPDAAAAFDSADALRAPAERCAWDDVSAWLEPGPGRAYRRLGCGSAERARWETRFWRLAQPLWMLPANDLRNEWHARRVMAIVHGGGANPYGLSWGDDLAELELRYGAPVGWSHQPRLGSAMSIYTFGSDVSAGVTGHTPAPSYDFVPRGDALRPTRAGVADVPTDAWKLEPPTGEPMPPMFYAPPYAGGGVGTPTHQVARFRHGDTAVVVGAYDAARDSLWSEGNTPPTLSAGLFVLDDSGAVAAADRRDSVARAGALVAQLPGAALAGQSDRRWLLGVELLQRDSVHTPDGRHVLGRALRARDLFHPLAADARISDLLVLRRSPGPTPDFAAALDSAAGTLDVHRGGSMGLYWEQYADSARHSADGAAAPDTIVIAATRLTRSFRERLAGALGLGKVERPIALRFLDPGGAGLGRAIGLTWPDVPAGDYRLEVTVVPGTPGRQPATSARVVHITED